jgi:hypothetical protein
MEGAKCTVDSPPFNRVDYLILFPASVAMECVIDLGELEIRIILVSQCVSCRIMHTFNYLLPLLRATQQLPKKGMNLESET